jgi:hypothetical protein
MHCEARDEAFRPSGLGRMEGNAAGNSKGVRVTYQEEQKLLPSPEFSDTLLHRLIDCQLSSFWQFSKAGRRNPHLSIPRVRTLVAIGRDATAGRSHCATTRCDFLALPVGLGVCCVFANCRT